MKLVYFESTSDEEKDQLAEMMPGEDIIIKEEMLQDDPEAAGEADAVSVFVKSQVTKELLDKMPALKFIATRSTGFDHIDLAECARRGIAVSNVPTYGENTVAEHAFALILSLSRKIFQSFEKTEKMDFNREELEGFDLMGKKLGVVGAGHIGRFVVKIGLGFGMEIVIYDVHPDAKYAQEMGVKFVTDLNDLLAVSDVITLHVPYIPDVTHHLINKENIKRVKEGAVIVNTSRGSILDTEALLWGLEEGPLSGAGLDVFEEENDTMDHVELWSKGFPQDHDIATILRNHILVSRDDVIITPHNAFNSKEAKQRIFKTTIENLKGYISGSLVNEVKVK